MKSVLIGSAIILLQIIASVVPKTYIDLTIEQYNISFLNDDLHPDFSKMKFIRRKKVGQCFVGTFEFKIWAGNDNTAGEAIIYKKEGNEFRLTPFKIKKSPVCDLLHSDPYFYSQVLEHSTLPRQCPIPPGNYSIDWCPDLSKVPPNFIGTYRIDATAHHWGKPNTLYSFVGRLDRVQMA